MVYIVDRGFFFVSRHEAIAHFGAHRSFLLAYARRLGASPDDAEDCAQQTLIGAFKNIDDFRGNDYQRELRCWLAVILRHAFFDSRRRLRARTSREHAVAASRPPQTECAGLHACELADVERALAELSEPLRQTFCEQALGAEYDEIAKRLGVPIGTVKSRLSRAREALQA